MSANKLLSLLAVLLAGFSCNILADTPYIRIDCDFDEYDSQFTVRGRVLNTTPVRAYTWQGTNVFDASGYSAYFSFGKDFNVTSMVVCTGAVSTSYIEFPITSNNFAHPVKEWYASVMLTKPADGSVHSMAYGALTIKAAPEVNASGTFFYQSAINGSAYGPFTGDFSGWPFIVTGSSGYVLTSVFNSTNDIFRGLIDGLTGRSSVWDQASTDGSAATSHIANVSNPHGVTASQAGAVATNDAAYLAALTSATITGGSSLIVSVTGRILGITVRTNFAAVVHEHTYTAITNAPWISEETLWTAASNTVVYTNDSRLTDSRSWAELNYLLITNPPALDFVPTDDVSVTNARPWDEPNYNTITNPPTIPTTNGFIKTGGIGAWTNLSEYNDDFAGSSTNLSDYNNDVPFVTGTVVRAEVDPVFTASVAYAISAADTQSWTQGASDASTATNFIGTNTLQSQITANSDATNAINTRIGTIEGYDSISDYSITDAYTKVESDAAYATGTPLYVEADPVWESEKSGYATGTPVYVESDPVWESEKAGYATGTPLYVESYVGTVTGGTVTAGSDNTFVVTGPNAAVTWNTNDGAGSGGAGTITNMLSSDGSIDWTNPEGPQPDGSVTSYVEGVAAGYVATNATDYTGLLTNTLAFHAESNLYLRVDGTNVYYGESVTITAGVTAGTYYDGANGAAASNLATAAYPSSNPSNFYLSSNPSNWDVGTITGGTMTAGAANTFVVTGPNAAVTWNTNDGAGGGGVGDFLADGSVPMTGDLDCDGNAITGASHIVTTGIGASIFIGGIKLPTDAVFDGVLVCATEVTGKMAIRKTLTNLNVLTSTNLIQSKSFALNGGNFDGGGNRATNFVNLVETNTAAYTNTAALAAAALPASNTNALSVTALQITGTSPTNGAVWAATNSTGQGKWNVYTEISAVNTTAYVLTGWTLITFPTVQSQIQGTWDGTNWTPGAVGMYIVSARGAVAGILGTTRLSCGIEKNTQYNWVLNTATYIGLNEWAVSGIVNNDSTGNVYRLRVLASAGTWTNNTAIPSAFNWKLLP